MHRFANPARFLRISAVILPWAVGLAALFIATGLYFALFASPPDYQQGESVRIMYVHVPSAWMASFVYGGLALTSAIALVWKHPLAHVAAKAMSPIGACFTFMALATGSLWGKPMWGTWWVWDARLTSVLILFFLYLGHMALLNAFEDSSRGERAAAVLALVGAINLPIIHWSVEWWNTLHQPASIFRMGGPTIDSAMLIPLFLMALGYVAYFVVVLILRMRGELLARKIRVIRMARVTGAEHLSASRATS
jgi:heme exporter protein C